jgi:hypothetical protein
MTLPDTDHGKLHRVSQLLAELRAVALIAISSRRYFEILKPPIEAFVCQMSHLCQKPAACDRSSNCAVAALSAERGGWTDVDQYKVKAAHWETVANTLGAVLSMEIDEGREEILLPDPWR